MTGKADFTEDEWRIVLEGPPTAGMIVVTAQGGGTFRETLAIAKAYVEARKQHGESELLDEIVSAKPEIDHTRYHSAEELKEHGLQHLRDAVELLERKGHTRGTRRLQALRPQRRRHGRQRSPGRRRERQRRRACGHRRDRREPRYSRSIGLIFVCGPRGRTDRLDDAAVVVASVGSDEGACRGSAR
jgi:hypothetical protein